MVMDQFSATEIFNTSIRDLSRPRLIQKRRNLLTLLNGDAFYPLSTWPQDIQQLFGKKPIGDTDTFKLTLFFLGNACSKHLITDWILTSQHWTTLQKGIKGARQIDFINNNLDSKATCPCLRKRSLCSYPPLPEVVFHMLFVIFTTIFHCINSFKLTILAISQWRIQFT